MREPKPNRKLLNARENRMWTQEEAAHEVGVEHQTYWRWENYVQWPRNYALRKLCTVFALEAVDLGFGVEDRPRLHMETIENEPDDGKIAELVLDEPPEQPTIVRLSHEQATWIASLLASGDEYMTFDQTKRTLLAEALRAAGVALTAPTMIAAIDPEPWERLTIAMTKPSTLNQATLNHFADLMRVTWGFSNGSELDVAEKMLPQFLPRLIQVAPAQPEAAVLAAQGLQLQSILAAHKLKVTQKIALCQQAVTFARSAHDNNTLVAALLQLAVAFNYDQQHDQALRSYQEAIMLCTTAQISPLLASRAYVEAAATFAHYQRLREADLYLEMAQEVFPSDPASDPAHLYADHNRAVISLYDGLIHLERGDAGRAWSGFESYKQYGATPERIRLEIVNHQGRSALLEQDLEKYAYCLQDGLDGAIKLGSRKRYNEAISFYQTIPATWQQHPHITGIAEQYQLK